MINVLNSFLACHLLITFENSFMGGSGGGTGGPDPPKKSQKIGLHSKTGADHLNNHKATKPVFNVGPSSARQRNPI